MGVEVRPLNVACNIQCLYCYQHPQRDASNVSRTYDLVKIKTAVQAEGRPFILFGGEALLMPLSDLEDLWAWGLDQFGRNSVQTNGTLINQKHIELFKRYKVSVGISIDGPEDLNDVRWHGNLETTRESTRKTETAIELLCKEGLSVGVIVTLHRGNAAAEKLPRLFAWIEGLCATGVKSIRIHLLESESPEIREKLGLTIEENIEALLGIRSLSCWERTKMDLFEDMRRLLLGDDRAASCVWKGCDPYTTHAVRGIEGNGRQSNCGRTNKDGIDFTKASSSGFERYLSLYYTPQSVGGCRDCRFFLMCKGQCPGTAMSGDWRLRSEHCEIWLRLFESLEADLMQQGHHVLSRSSERMTIEAAAIETWGGGRHFSLYDAYKAVNATTPEGSDSRVRL